MTTTITRDLISLSRDLGSPVHGWAVAAEGNASAHVNDESFQVKRRGTLLGAVADADLIDVLFQPILHAIDSDENFTSTQLHGLLKRSKVHPGSVKMPEADTVLHAALLHIRGVRFVGHSYPASINSLANSGRGWDTLCSGGRMWPEEVVVCGHAPCCVEYAEMGIDLARAVKRKIADYIARYETPPKTIYIQNHGFIALGATARDVLGITQMAEKSARSLLGALSVGEPKFLAPSVVDEIHARREERARNRELTLAA